MCKNYEIPPIVWLRVTDYMHGWLQYELGAAARIGEQHVVCLMDLPGASEVLKMETVEDIELRPMKIINTMSATRKNLLEAGMVIDAAVIEREYGMTPDEMRQFVPVECPKRCLTRFGVLRPWTLDIALSRQQAYELQCVVRAAFWHAVERFNADYALAHGTTDYPQIDMIEAFCRITGTSDTHAEAISREWRRRLKSGQSKA